MRVETVFLPSQLKPQDVSSRSVVVFDVLRATTTIAAAFEQGVKEIRVFGDLASAKSAAATHTGPRLLCGEQRCLPPEGFDLGNSPLAFDRRSHDGRTMFLSTTNGTRAFMAARAAPRLLAGALVNASAVARFLVRQSADVTLLCAGTDGVIAMEDVLGAGAVIRALCEIHDVTLESDAARLSDRLFQGARHDLPAILSTTQGGLNIRSVGLDEDIAYASRLDALNVVGVVRHADPTFLTLTVAGSD